MLAALSLVAALSTQALPQAQEPGWTPRASTVRLVKPPERTLVLSGGVTLETAYLASIAATVTFIGIYEAQTGLVDQLGGVVAGALAFQFLGMSAVPVLGPALLGTLFLISPYPAMSGLYFASAGMQLLGLGLIVAGELTDNPRRGWHVGSAQVQVLPGTAATPLGASVVASF